VDFDICEFIQVLLLSCKVMAPFTPFFTEVLYQNMRKVCSGSEESIHYCSFPAEEGKVYILINSSLYCLLLGNLLSIIE
jgi:isoleucyl-tRNA synthetase